MSRSRLVKLLTEGAVQVNGVVVTDQKAKVAEGDQISILVEEAVETALVAEDIALDVVYEDDDLIVINKPVGMVVHPAPGSPRGTLVNALMHHCGDSLSGIGGERRPGIVHRIDKDTSGLLVVAKSDQAHQGLAKQFEKHSVERKYIALVYGAPDPDGPAFAWRERCQFRRLQHFADHHVAWASQDRPAETGGELQRRPPRHHPRPCA